MATRLKTVAFPLPNLASIPDASLTNFTQITVDLPESSKTFRKAWVDFMANDIISATGGTINEWRLGARLGASAYTTITNTNDITNSGENMAPFICQDFTSLFTASWSGTSMTFDVQVYLDQSTGTTLGYVSGSAILWVTYEYDDTSATQVMNAWIPMTSAVNGLPTSKGSAQDTVPALDSFLGYGSISYKHIMMIMEGNEAGSAAVTDFALTVQLDTTTAQVGNSHECALQSDRYVREHFNLMSGGSPIFTTNATHSFYAWVSTGAVSRMNHASFTILVTFTFDATSANDGNISLLLPMQFDSPAGGTTSADAQKGSRELWIQETSPSIQKSAFRFHWEQIGAIVTAYFRCGTQSFVSITDVAAAMCGGNVHQRTCDDNISLARGRNSLSADVYRTDTSDKMWNLSGVWIINYICDKPANGWGEANHTVIWPLNWFGTGVTSSEVEIAATAPIIPETNYFINALGVKVANLTSSTSTLYSYNVYAERLSAEGGPKWEEAYKDTTHTDPEVGLRQFYSQMRSLFKRFPTDADPTRIDLETSRRWKIISGYLAAAWWSMAIIFTYHSKTYTVSGTISGSNGGTVNLYLHKSDAISEDNAGERMQVSSRSGNGAYSFTVYDNVENLFVDAYEDSTHLGKSAYSTAT